MSKLKIAWTEDAWKDYQYWQTHDMKIFKRINTLIEECQESPTTGSASPENLIGYLSELWSRRINENHRLIYKISNNEIIIVSCRHYSN